MQDVKIIGQLLLIPFLSFLISLLQILKLIVRQRIIVNFMLGVFVMNRKTKRLMQNKLGVDFPLDKLIVVYSYYAKSYNMSLEDFMVKVLREYTEEKYKELVPILERMSEDDTI